MAADVKIGPSGARNSRPSRPLILAVSAFFLGGLCGLGVAALRIRVWSTTAIANQTRAITIYQLEALARLRTGKEAEAIDLLEASVFRGAVSTLEARGWNSMSAKERRAVLFAKLYGDRVGWPNAANARAKLAAVPEEGFKIGDCSSSLYAFLKGEPSPSRSDAGSREKPDR